ncbi:MAG: glycosyltransferase family 4 protein [Bacteroidetes Order II. Incertae sedis bacterium]|nr:glycosyltransferase family 4 protein [Bacteroidetes Order II. bacterium]
MKQVLFIAYYFPPSGGPGVQRSLKFVRYLPTYGWMPTVLTVDPAYAAFPAIDPSLIAEVPPEVEIHRTRAFNPLELYARFTGRKDQTVTVGTLHEATTPKERLMQWLRANLFIPDARIGWNRPALQKALNVIHSRPFDAIITTSPPHSTHLIGLKLHQKTGIPWLADFRDPWTDISYYHTLPHTRLAHWWDAKLESKVLNGADLVTMVSPYYLRQMQERMQHPERMHLLSNGFDPNDFPPMPHIPTKKEQFTLAYTGSLFVNPSGLWQAIADIRRDWPTIRLQFTGRTDERVLADMHKKHIDDILIQQPYVAHEEALLCMQTADALLLVIEEKAGTEGILTGKLFEYLATGKPILAIGPPNGDAAKVLRAAGAGEMISHQDVAAIRNRIETLLSDSDRSSVRPYPQNFTRQRLTQNLASLLDGLPLTGSRNSA